jgi:hypothetical protein
MSFPAPPVPYPPRQRSAVEARAVVTWAGAALLLAGALAFATVIWRYSGELGRLAILGAVTALAVVGADRLRRTTPVTAEAFTAIAAGMVVVDSAAAYLGGYHPAWSAPWWAAVTLLPAGAAFVALSRRWSSPVAGVCGGILVGLGSAALALAPYTADVDLAAHDWTVTLVALSTAGLGVLSRHVPDRARRGAVLAAAWSAWTVQALSCLVALTVRALALALGDDLGPRPVWAGAIVALLVGLPLLVRPAGVGRAWFAGALAGLVLVIATARSVFEIAAPLPSGPAPLLELVACFWLLALVPSLAAWAALHLPAPYGGDRPHRVRAQALALVTAGTFILAGLDVLAQVKAARGPVATAYLLVALSMAAAVPLVAVGRRVASWVASALVAVPLAGAVGALALAAQVWPHGRPGDYVAVAGALLLLASTLSLIGTDDRRWLASRARPALWCVGGISLALAPSWGVSSVENWSVPAAAGLAAVGLLVHRRDASVTSWAVEAPAAAMLLIPSCLQGLDSENPAARLSAVTVVAVLLLLDAANRRRRGHAMVAVGVIAAVIARVLVPRLGQVPSWQLLSISGALLMWVGFTWERRRASARHVAHAWSTWA